MNISRKAYDRLLADSASLNKLGTERDNLRKAYEEVNARSEQQAAHFKRQIEDLTRILQNAQASNQQLSREHVRLFETSKALALDKDKMSEANRKLVDLLSTAVENYNRVMNEREHGTA